jgi:hypothetical protein
MATIKAVVRTILLRREVMDDATYERREGKGMRLTLNEQGLTALTLLIAESDPKAKDLMVRLTMNLIAEAAPTPDDQDSTQ